MTKRYCFASRVAICLAALTIGQSANAVDGIGAVDLVEVWAYGTPPGGERDAIFRGHQVYTDETIETVRGGFVHMTFVDGTTLALGESTMLVLDDFVYDPNAADNMVADFAGGLFHLVSGDIDKGAVLISTPAMAIGLRGTDIVVQVGDDGTTDLAVIDGSVTATPTAGGPAVDVNAGQTVSGSPGDTTLILVNGLPNFATRDLPTATKGRRNLGGGDRSGGTAGGGSGNSSDVGGSDSSDPNG